MLISAPVLSSVVTAGAESVESLQAQLDELERKNAEYQATLDKTESDIASKEGRSTVRRWSTRSPLSTRRST